MNSTSIAAVAAGLTPTEGAIFSIFGVCGMLGDDDAELFEVLRFRGEVVPVNRGESMAGMMRMVLEMLRI
jgi:hypothetical protein